MKRMLGLVCGNYQYGDFGLLTKERPIASIPFGGRYRLIDFPISNMVNSGIDSVGLITPYLYRSLLDHVGNGKAFGLARKTGGLFILPGSIYGLQSNKEGKLLLRDIKGNRSFLERTTRELLCIESASKIYNLDYRDVRDFHDQNNAAITLVYKKQKNGVVKHDYNLEVSSDNRVLDINNKETGAVNQFIDALIINIDLMLKIIDWYNKQSYMNLLDIIKELLPNITVYAYEFKGYTHNIDGISDYMDASMELLNPKVMDELFNPERPILTKVQDAPPVKYEEKSKVSNSLIATGSIIRGSIQSSIIFRNVVVEEGAKIKNSVIMQHCHIAKNTVLENVILDKYAYTQEHEEIKGSKERPLSITKEQYN